MSDFPDAVRAPSAYDEAFAACRAELDLLDKYLDDLRERIDPIVGPSFPSTSEAEKAVDVADSSSVVRDLRGIRSRIENQNGRLGDLLHRIEV